MSRRSRRRPPDLPRRDGAERRLREEEARAAAMEAAGNIIPFDEGEGP